MTVRKFETITGIAAYLPEADVDTDLILPARFLLLLEKEGLGSHLFHDLRKKAPTDKPFILDTPPYDNAEILIAGSGFGTGSSREQAVWALDDFGIRCIIALGFGEIFYANCVKNGILPIVMEADFHHQITTAVAQGEQISVDLEQKQVVLQNGNQFDFSIDAHHRSALLNGLDEIGDILANDTDEISKFETGQRALSPWLYLDDEQLSTFEHYVSNNLNRKASTL